MEDYVTPDYHKKIAQGAIINNPCVYTRSTVSISGEGSYGYDDGTSSDYLVSGCVSTHVWNAINASFLTLDPPSLNAEAGKARAKQLAIANIDSTPYAFGEDVLELRETLRFLRNPVQSLLGLSRAFRSARKSGFSGIGSSVKKTSTAFADVWLQYRFAASPLVRSIADGLDAYASELPTPPERLSARGFHESNGKTADAYTNGQWHFDRSIVKQVSGKASILYTVTNPVYDWNYRLGFRVKDVPTTFWQVMPYSFMVDRALDLTAFLKGVINLADPNVKILMGCYSRKYEYTQKYTLTGRDKANWTLNAAEDHVETQFEYSRVPWSPSVSDTIPRLQLEGLISDATKMLDLVALILGNFR